MSEFELETDETPDEESYFIRLLATKTGIVSVGGMLAELKKARLPFKLMVEAGTDEQWEQLTLEHRQGETIAVIERLPVIAGGVGAEMIAFFADSLPDSKPVSGAKWVADYLPKVKTIYSFQVLDGAEVDRGWDGLYILQSLLHRTLGGIFQSDNEGFSNEQEAHVVWQFDDDVEGPWKMAVWKNGRWQSFQMDLENRGARRAFMEGRVPETQGKPEKKTPNVDLRKQKPQTRNPNKRR